MTKYTTTIRYGSVGWSWIIRDDRLVLKGEGITLTRWGAKLAAQRRCRFLHRIKKDAAKTEARVQRRKAKSITFEC